MTEKLAVFNLQTVYICKHEATIWWHWSVTSALSFAVQRLVHCPLGKTSVTLVLNTKNKNIGESLQNRSLDFYIRETYKTYLYADSKDSRQSFC